MRSVAFVVMSLGLAVAGPALAQSDASGQPPNQVLMPPKRVFARALFEINLSDGAAGDPFSLAPDVWYGLDEHLTLGLIHSSVGSTGIMGGVGASLCLAGDACPDVYDNLGIEARYQKWDLGVWRVAANGGFFIGSLDPFQLAVKLGAAIRRELPVPGLTLDLAPALFIGLSERDSGNKELLALPATVIYALQDKIALSGQLGLLLPFADAGDLYALSLAVGGSYEINRQISVLAALALPALAGGEARVTGFDARTFTLGGTYAF